MVFVVCDVVMLLWLALLIVSVYGLVWFRCVLVYALVVALWLWWVWQFPACCLVFGGWFGVFSWRCMVVFVWLVCLC